MRLSTINAKAGDGKEKVAIAFPKTSFACTGWLLRLCAAARHAGAGAVEDQRRPSDHGRNSRRSLGNYSGSVKTTLGTLHSDEFVRGLDAIEPRLISDA
jgi:hypothetical protein